MLGALLWLLAGPSSSEVIVSQDAEGRCKVIVGGRAFDQPTDREAIEKAFTSLPDKEPVTVIGSPAAASPTWQCVGGIIYTLQRLGKVKVGFIAEPPRE